MDCYVSIYRLLKVLHEFLTAHEALWVSELVRVLIYVRHETGIYWPTRVGDNVSCVNNVTPL